MGKSAKLKAKRINNWINNFHRQTDRAISIRNPKERDRLVEVIKTNIKKLQSNQDGVYFPTQLYNLENLVDAAVIVKNIPEFSNYCYSFKMEYLGDPSMGYVLITKPCCEIKSNL